MVKGRIMALMIGAAMLAGCVAPPSGTSAGGADAVNVVRSTEQLVVLRGPIDATRTTPPARYDDAAATRCARHGKTAVFRKMEQGSTFGFDVTYDCVSKA